MVGTKLLAPTCCDPMIAYLTDDRLATLTRTEGYVSWGVYNLFLTPAHNWINNWIHDGTREWDPALNMSAVWPNCRQGIISLSSGRAVGQFFEPRRAEPSRGEAKGRKWKHLSGALRRYYRVSGFPRIFCSLTQTSSGFWRFDRLPSEGSKNKGYAWLSPATA